MNTGEEKVIDNNAEAYMDFGNENEVLEKQLGELAAQISKHPVNINNKPGLLVVDVQNYFFSDSSPLFLPVAPVLFEKIKKTVELFRHLSFPVLFTKHIDSASNAMEKWWGHGFVKSNSLSDIFIDTGEDTVITKESYDAFYKTSLENILLSMDIDQLFMCGVQSHLCIESTARSAFVRGFNPVIVLDATGAKNETLHMAAMSIAARGFATISCFSEIKKCIARQ